MWELDFDYSKWFQPQATAVKQQPSKVIPMMSKAKLGSTYRFT